MEHKDIDTQVVAKETESKEKKIMSMDSAIQRLQKLSKATNTDKSAEDIHKEQTSENDIEITFDSVEKKVVEDVKDKKSSKKEMQVDYNIQQNDLDSTLLDDDTLSEEEDAKHNKGIAWLAYILFFIPLLINKKSPFVRLHANEGLDVFIIDVFASILMICGKFVNFGSKLAILGHLMFLGGIGLFVLTGITKIFQIIRVAMGKKNQTPWLWKTRIIK